MKIETTNSMQILAILFEYKWHKMFSKMIVLQKHART